jgi:hypothetical protein
LLDFFESVDTIYLQGNHFTGLWPAELCKSCPSCLDGIYLFGIDADEVDCGTMNCCDFITNKFYPQDEEEDGHVHGSYSFAASDTAGGE